MSASAKNQLHEKKKRFGFCSDTICLLITEYVLTYWPAWSLCGQKFPGFLTYGKSSQVRLPISDQVPAPYVVLTRAPPPPMRSGVNFQHPESASAPEPPEPQLHELPQLHVLPQTRGRESEVMEHEFTLHTMHHEPFTRCLICVDKNSYR